MPPGKTASVNQAGMIRTNDGAEPLLPEDESEEDTSAPREENERHDEGDFQQDQPHEEEKEEIQQQQSHSDEGVVGRPASLGGSEPRAIAGGGGDRDPGRPFGEDTSAPKPGFVSVDHADVLVRMGYDRQRARLALVAARGSLEEAVDLLLTLGESTRIEALLGQQQQREPSVTTLLADDDDDEEQRQQQNLGDEEQQQEGEGAIVARVEARPPQQEAWAASASVDAVPLPDCNDDEEGSSSQIQPWMRWALGLLFLASLGIAIAIALLILLDDDDGPPASSVPAPSPTATAPPVFPSSSHPIEAALAVYFRDDFPGSPQQQAALDWLLYEDPSHPSGTEDPEALLQRFVLALFFQTVIAANNGTESPTTHGWMSERAVCDWKGVGCEKTARPVLVTRLLEEETDEEASDDDDGLVLEGTFPTELGLLTGLTDLRLTAQSGLTGRLPTEVGRLTGLRFLRLERNRLGGTLPTELGLLEDLEVLALGNNRFFGRIPTELGKLTGRLDVCGLSNNALSGRLPSELGRLTNLLRLEVQCNRLDTVLPPELFRLANNSGC